MFRAAGSSEIADLTTSSIYYFFRPERLFLFFYALGDDGEGSIIVICEDG